MQIRAVLADTSGMARVKVSPFLGELQGSLGNVSFRQTRFGVQMIERQIPRDPRTPAQVAARERMSLAARVWTSLTLEQAAAWRLYAESLVAGPLDPAPNPSAVFCALAVRVLAVNPAAAVPLMPPADPFAGDAVRLKLVQIAPPGKVRLECLQGNSPGVTAELLLQPLGSIHRAAYREKYRTAGFFDLVTGTPVELPSRAGAVAVAMRTVVANTGQAGSLLELGRTLVG